MKNLRSSFKLLFGGLCLIVICIFGVFACKESSSKYLSPYSIQLDEKKHPLLSIEKEGIECVNFSHYVPDSKDSKGWKFHVINTDINVEDRDKVVDKIKYFFYR